MRSSLSTCLLLVALVPGPDLARARENPFGVMIPGPPATLTARITLAKTLGVRYYRPLAMRLDQEEHSAEAEAAHDAGLQLVMLLRAGNGTPMRDVDRYQWRLRGVLQRYTPALVIIESELDGNPGDYSGTPAQYFAQLKAATVIADELDVPCTDGGLSSKGISTLVIMDYQRDGKTDRAIDFARRTLFPKLPRGAAAAQELIRELEKDRAYLARLRVLEDGLRKNDTDFVNFHWYESDAPAMGEAIDYLQRLTRGKPVVTTNIGQRNTDRAETAAKLAAIREARLPIAIWFSQDTSDTRSLDEGFQLRPTGQRFRDFVHSGR